MKKYWQILKKYKISLLACPLLVLVSVMCETVQPMYMADIIDNGVMQRDLSVITAVGGKMILISIVGLIFSIANVYVSSHASIGFGTDLRTGLFGKIQQLSFFDIDRFSTASLITRLTSDISRIQQVIMMSMRPDATLSADACHGGVFRCTHQSRTGGCPAGCHPYIGFQRILYSPERFPLLPEGSAEGGSTE